MTSSKCELCGAEGASLEDIRGEAIVICPRCAEQLVARNAYEQSLPALATMLRERNFEGALKLLDDLIGHHGRHDKDGWLQQSVLSERALILSDSGRLEEARDAHQARIALGFRDPSDEAVEHLRLAIVQLGTSETEQAVQNFRHALTMLELSDPRAAFPILCKWIEAAAPELDEAAFHDKIAVVHMAVAARSLQAPEHLTSKPRDLVEWASENLRSQRG